MSKIKDSYNEGMKQAENIKETPKYIIAGLISVAIYEYLNIYYLALFYAINIAVDLGIAYRKGDLQR